MESSGQAENRVWCEALYEAKASELLLYGRALGLSHSEAEDVLQETFIALCRLPAPPEEPEYYCLRAFRNRVFNYRRSLWKRLTRELEAKEWFEPGQEESPAEHKAMRCLQDLPAEQREVIVLKIWHQYTFEEIGRLLEVSPNTVAGRYRYGMQKLKACLKEDQYERLESLGSAAPVLGAASPLA
jgi:RNA polymerase sigma-70 factor (ECF subfamily)